MLRKYKKAAGVARVEGKLDYVIAHLEKMDEDGKAKKMVLMRYESGAYDVYRDIASYEEGYEMFRADTTEELIAYFKGAQMGLTFLAGRD